MSVYTDLKAFQSDMNVATDAIAAKIEALLQKNTNSMSDAERDEVNAGFQAIADHLKALGKDDDNPLPPPPTT